jgi:hypothetical protein
MNAHDTHCCIEHGCKYGQEDCPVANGVRRQQYMCETCMFESEKQVVNLTEEQQQKFLDMLWDKKSEKETIPTKEQIWLLDFILQYAIKYDKANGSYPENCYEGISFYKFVHDELTGKLPDVRVIRDQNKDVYKNIW